MVENYLPPSCFVLQHVFFFNGRYAPSKGGCMLLLINNNNNDNGTTSNYNSDNYLTCKIR
jgi:hypothetical protein